jgi:cytochrome P450
MIAEVNEPVRLDRDFVQDPHGLYRRLRAEAPAHPVVMWGGVRAWLVTRYAEARALLNDPRLSKDQACALALFPPGTDGSHASSLNVNMLLKDPPDHTRLRRLVSKAFTARAVEHLRAGIEQIADELLDGIELGAADGAVDLMEHFAAPLPIRVIGELLGVPAADRDNFKTGVEPVLTNTNVEELRTALAGLTTLLSDLIADKRERPAYDLLTALVGVSDHGDQLSEDELLATAYLLILAGYETTVNLIGNGILALLRNPAQLAFLRAEPSGLPDAVEEFLRFESPLNIETTRFTTVPIGIGGVEVPADEFVMIALLAPNHDSDQFDAPERPDVTRKPNAHLAFGHGIHYCLGAPLARLEGEIALGRLLARFENMSLDNTVTLQYRNSTLMRGLKTLPVRLG